MLLQKIFMIQLWIVRVKQQQRLEMGSVSRMVHRTAVNESKLDSNLKNPIMWDNEQVQVVFLLAFRLSTRDEISRIQMFYKEYVTLIDSEEKLEKLKSMKSNIELYKYLIQ